MNFNFRGSWYSLPNGAEYSQFACLTLSLDHGAVIQQKSGMMTKNRKRHKIMSLQFLHTVGLGLSGRFSSLLGWEEEDYLRGEKVKITENILFLCVCVCIQYNL